MKSQQINMVSLFAGIGGIDLAAAMAGIKTVGLCEIDPYCQQILRKNFPDAQIFDDVRTITKELLENAKITEVDILSGGFPCQPFSTAGKQRGLDDIRNLFPQMLRLAKEIRPTWIVCENVNGFIKLGIDTLLTQLEMQGYTALPFLLPATGVGAPHHRKRIFVVAHTSGDGWSDDLHWKSRRATFPQSNTGTWNGRLLDQPGIQRVVDGLPSKLDKARLKALGNAVVPAQIYPIFKAIMEIERIKNSK